MVAWLLPLFARLGLGERVSRVLAYASTAIGMIALLGLLWAIWLHGHDKGVVARHEAPIAAAVASATASAEAAADANDLVRASARAAADADARKAIDDASAKDPDAVRRPAGPAVRAVADSLRHH